MTQETDEIRSSTPDRSVGRFQQCLKRFEIMGKVRISRESFVSLLRNQKNEQIQLILGSLTTR